MPYGISVEYKRVALIQGMNINQAIYEVFSGKQNRNVHHLSKDEAHKVRKKFKAEKEKQEKKEKKEKKEKGK